MEPIHLFELVIGMFVAIIALHYVAHRLGLPPSVALLSGGAMLAFIPGLPAIAVDPELVLVIFLPPLLLDGAWTIAVGRLRRHLIGIASLAIGAVFFTAAVVAVVTHLIFPSLPWAACAALGAIVSPPDAVSARAVLQRVQLPRRLQILLEGESLLNDASGLVLFRFAIAAGVTGAFSAGEAVGNFFLLAIGGALVGLAIGTAWVLLARRLGDEYLIIAATALLSWTSYLLGEFLHVSGVIATVTTGLVASWHQHTVLSAATRMRGSAFWTVIVFLMEAAVFILIGLSLRGVVERGGGFETVAATLGWPILMVLFALTVARFFWGVRFRLRNLAWQQAGAQALHAGRRARCDRAFLGRRSRRGNARACAERARRLPRPGLHPGNLLCRDPWNGADAGNDARAGDRLGEARRAFL